MPISLGSVPVKTAYLGATPLKAIYLGSTQVWSFIKPTEVLPSNTAVNGTRDDFRTLLTKYGLNYTTVRELPFNLDTSQVTNMYAMFSGCSSLVSVPDMNTSKVTNMNFMFDDCSSLVSVPDMDTSNVTSMNSMFGGCRSLVSVPDMNTSNVTSMNSMFVTCWSLVSVPDMNTSNVTSTNYMFDRCSSLKDGKVRLIRPSSIKPSNRLNMIRSSGLTREPFFLPDGTPIN